MKKVAIAIHGGAGDEDPENASRLQAIEQGLREALLTGYELLQQGRSALIAVEEAVKILEDNPCFNAGRGSALNSQGEVEMDAAIMDGKSLEAGAVSIIRCVKNPIVLARMIKDDTAHVFLSGPDALNFAKEQGLSLEDNTYFITEYQQQELAKTKSQAAQKSCGTVGAVAIDQEGNLAAATSTGGISGALPGRVGDSCIIGAGCYANNQTCAVSATGDGEIILLNVIGHAISKAVELSNLSLQEACDQVLFAQTRPCKGQMGVISIDKQANISISFNSRALKRAWIASDQNLQVKIFR